MEHAIDRISPTMRPPGPALGLQKWRHLLFVHWEIDAALLRPLLPARLEIDTYEGRAYVGLIPFTMPAVRPLRLLPRPPIVGRFHETNLRTYVHLDGQPGIWFFSLDAASRLAVWAARTFFHLPYVHARMALSVQGSAVSYRSRRGRKGPHLSVRYEIGEPLPPSAPGTLQFFLAERYYLYTTRRDGTLLRGQVHHAPYPLRRAVVHELSESLTAAAGLRIPAGAARPPDLYSPGVDVEIFPLTKV
jgi:hypothetical protein